MVLKGFVSEFVSPVPAAQMFKAGIIESHELVPKLIPNIVKGITVEGDGGAGSIKQTNFTDVISFPYARDRIEVLDKEKLVFKYTLVEGGRLGKKYAAATYEVRFEPSSDGGGCVCKMTGHFEAYSEDDFTEEDLNVGKYGLMAMYKAVEAYLLANPKAYI